MAQTPRNVKKLNTAIIKVPLSELDKVLESLPVEIIRDHVMVGRLEDYETTRSCVGVKLYSESPYYLFGVPEGGLIPTTTLFHIKVRVIILKMAERYGIRPDLIGDRDIKKLQWERRGDGWYFFVTYTKSNSFSFTGVASYYHPIATVNPTLGRKLHTISFREAIDHAELFSTKGNSEVHGSTGAKLISPTDP